MVKRYLKSLDRHIFSMNLLSSPRRHQEGFDKLPKQGAQACLSSCPCSQGPSASPAYIVNHQADCTSMTLSLFHHIYLILICRSHRGNHTGA